MVPGVSIHKETFIIQSKNVHTVGSSSMESAFKGTKKSFLNSKSFFKNERGTGFENIV